MTAGLIDFSILKGAPLVQTSGLGAFAEGLNSGLNSAADRSYKENMGKSSLADFQVKKQGILADAAYAVNNMDPAMQEAGYNQTIGQLVQAGLVKPNEVPAWNQGGQQLVSGLAKTSSKYLENQKLLVDAAYKNSQLQIDQQKADAATLNANTNAKKSTLTNDPFVAAKAKQDAKQVATAADAFTKASQNAKDMENLLALAPKANIGLGHSITGAANYALGTEAAQNNDTIDKITNAYALQQRAGGQMPGSMSDPDREFLVKMAPNRNDSYNGFIQKAKIAQAGALREKEYSLAMQDWGNTYHTLDGFQSYWDKLQANKQLNKGHYEAIYTKDQRDTVLGGKLGSAAAVNAQTNQANKDEEDIPIPSLESVRQNPKYKNLTEAEYKMMIPRYIEQQKRKKAQASSQGQGLGAVILQ